MTSHLAPARRADCPQIGRILLGWVEETDWMPCLHPRDSYADFAALRKAVSSRTVARADGRVVGFIARQGSDVQALYVARPWRGRGIGKALLDHAKAGAGEGRLTLWTFQASQAARRFYRREGFAETRLTGGAGNDEGLPDVQMSWERKDDG